MRRVIVLSVVAVLGCKRGEVPKQVSTAGPAPMPVAVGGGPDAGDEHELLPGATCAFPTKIDEDIVIRSGCVADVKTNVLVANGKTLTIEPGVRLRFHEKSYIEIGHRGSRLIAKGTKDKPIVFTSGASAPAKGDWIGLVFDDAVGPGTIIQHAVIEYAGRESHGGHGAITVFRDFPAGNLSIRDVTFANNAVAAINNTHSVFGAFERNVFNDNAVAIRASLGVIASIGDSNDFGDVVEIAGGTLNKKGTLPKARAGYLISEPINVNGEGNDVGALTVAKGSVLRFASKTWLEIGTGGAAEFQASGVTFTSAAPTPHAGDWVGLFFGEKTKRAMVTDSLIEYAGAEEHSSDAAVTFVGSKSWQALDVHFSGVTFKNLQQAHFSSNGDGCNKALDPRFGIVWTNVEPCK